MIHLTNMNESLGYSRWDFFYPMNHNALTLFTMQDTTFYGDTGFGIRMHPRYQSGYKENIPDGWLVSNDYDRQYASGGTGTSGHKTFAELFGDGDWHKVTYTLVGNSSLEALDGVYRIAIDDVAIVERTTVEWADDPYWSGCATCINPPDDFIGWNYITIGGNAYNRKDDPSVKSEQWYAIDDLVVYSVDGESDYNIKGSSFSGVKFQ